MSTLKRQEVSAPEQPPPSILYELGSFITMNQFFKPGEKGALCDVEYGRKALGLQ